MDLECPYCGSGLEVNDDDGFGFEQDFNHQMECDECGKNFVLTTSIQYFYEPAQADCLNDGNHSYRLSHTFPKEFSKMVCEMCGDKVELTDEQRLEFGIGTKESYFDSLK